MTDLKKQVGQNIKKLRVEKGMTQEKLAEAASISVDFLSLVERGRNAPSFETIERIARALGVSAKELFN